MILFLEETRKLLVGKLTTLAPSFLEVQVVPCTGTDRYSKCGFAFPTHKASASTTIQELTECLTHCMEYHKT